jgi:hypothetical protein
VVQKNSYFHFGLHDDRNKEYVMSLWVLDGGLEG